MDYLVGANTILHRSRNLKIGIMGKNSLKTMKSGSIGQHRVPMNR